MSHTLSVCDSIGFEEVQMAKNRKKAEEYIFKYISKLDSSGHNLKLYKDKFKLMSNKDFDEMMTKIRNGEYVLPIFSPNKGDVKLSSKTAIKVAKELGHEFFERLWLTDNVTGETYLTPIKYLVVDLPLRRQQQLLIKKMSIPSVDMTMDALTNQVTGDSKGASLSFPELQVLAASGMHKSIEEMIKVRGGDITAYNQFRHSIINTGSGTLENAGKTEGRVKSTETLSNLLKGMHLDNNL